MSKTVCQAAKQGIVKQRGRPSIEFYKDEEPQYYCYGYINAMTDEILEVCKNCKDNVIYAQDDLDKWRATKNDGNGTGGGRR